MTNIKGGKGLHFKLTDEQEAMRKVARKFAVKEIAPIAIDFDERDEFPWEIVKKLHEKAY